MSDDDCLTNGQCEGCDCSWGRPLVSKSHEGSGGQRHRSFFVGGTPRRRFPPSFFNPRHLSNEKNRFPIGSGSFFFHTIKPRPLVAQRRDHWSRLYARDGSLLVQFRPLLLGLLGQRPVLPNQTVERVVGAGALLGQIQPSRRKALVA